MDEDKHVHVKYNKEDDGRHRVHNLVTLAVVTICAAAHGTNYRKADHREESCNEEGEVAAASGLGAAELIGKIHSQERDRE